MTHRFADLTFTDGVKAAQDHYGSLAHNTRLQENFGPNDQLSARETDFIAQRDTFYLATVSETGWPYVQHRGGPPGFLKVSGPNQLAYADFRGNTQLISVGNVLKNGRSGDIKEMAQVDLPDYKARIERIVFIDVVAFDWNCPQHITRRYTEPEFEDLSPRAVTG